MVHIYGLHCVLVAQAVEIWSSDMSESADKLLIPQGTGSSKAKPVWPSYLFKLGI